MSDIKYTEAQKKLRQLLKLRRVASVNSPDYSNQREPIGHSQITATDINLLVTMAAQQIEMETRIHERMKNDAKFYEKLEEQIVHYKSQSSRGIIKDLDTVREDMKNLLDNMTSPNNVQENPIVKPEENLREVVTFNLLMRFATLTSLRGQGEEALGDLEEKFERDCLLHGKSRAKSILAWDIAFSAAAVIYEAGRQRVIKLLKVAGVYRVISYFF